MPAPDRGDERVPGPRPGGGGDAAGPGRHQASPVRGLLEAVRFLLELAMLAGLAVAGAAASAVLAVGLPVAAAAVWGTWVAPKAQRRLADPARLAVEVVLFTVAGVALAAAGHAAAGAGLAVASTAVAVALRAAGSRV